MLSAQFINTVLVIAAAAIALFIIYHIVKGILKLAAIVLLLLLLYAGLPLVYRRKASGSGEEMMRRLSEKLTWCGRGAMIYLKRYCAPLPKRRSGSSAVPDG